MLPQSGPAPLASPGVSSNVARVGSMARVIKHHRRRGGDKNLNQNRGIDLKMSCCVVSSSFSSVSPPLPPPLCWRNAWGHVWVVYRTRSLFLTYMWIHAGAWIKSCQLRYTYARRRESGISDRVQPIKYNSWLLPRL